MNRIVVDHAHVESCTPKVEVKVATASEGDMPVHATFDTRAETCIVGTDLLSAVGAEKSELMPPQDAVITVTGQHLECIGLSKSLFHCPGLWLCWNWHMM